MASLSPELGDRILARLSIADAPSADLYGFRAIYAAWCLNVPFDNLAKLIALRTTPDEPLPGMDATEFFERWLEHGVGGTCWSTSNALCELLISLGFNARRVAGSMGDTGFVDPTDHSYYVERFEASRARSPFNDRLYLRRNHKSERIVLAGNKRIKKSADGAETSELNAAELCATLIDECGISKEFVDDWRACGALEASFAPQAPPPQPPVTHIPPSQRLNRDVVAPSIYGPTADEGRTPPG